MTRLIDANALFEKVGNIKPKNKSEYELLGKFMNMITYSPTISIRCFECGTNCCRAMLEGKECPVMNYFIVRDDIAE